MCSTRKWKMHKYDAQKDFGRRVGRRTLKRTYMKINAGIDGDDGRCGVQTRSRKRTDRCTAHNENDPTLNDKYSKETQ